MRRTCKQPFTNPPRGGRFIAAAAGWERQRHLAQASEDADLTLIQAEAARLAADGNSYRAIALALSVSYRDARRATLLASAKLRQAHPQEEARQRRELRDLYWCLRNRRSTQPALVYRYAEIPGGYSETPVGLPAKPHGAVPEDLLFSPLHFLREFARRLSVCERAEALMAARD